MGWLDWVRPRREEPDTDRVALRTGRRTLVASAAVVTPEQGRALAKRTRNRRWQTASFVYRRELPEVGYVMRFLGHNSTHIRLTVAERRRGGDQVLELDDDYGWLDADTPDPDALPWDLVDAAQEALAQLTGDSPSGGGAAILSPVVQAFEGPGECWLIGQYDLDTDTETWGIHSISEVTFHEGRMAGSDTRGFYRLTTGEGRDAERVDLDPATTTCIRLWTADVEWSSEPDSPMRTLVGTCERLLLIDRANDAVLRSRASGNGVILMPEEISQPPAPGEDEEPGEDELMRDFTTQLVTPLSQDGSAASVVPMILRGPYAYLDRVRHLTLDRPMDPKLVELETRLLARLGIGMDVPPEVITGFADINHWNVAQVDVDTFKHHQEPITIASVEALTIGYLRLRLRIAQKWPVDLINRVLFWYDPANLVSPPDMREIANDAFDRQTISAKAHRRLLGLDEGDAPEQAQATADSPVGDTGLLAAQLTALFDIAGTAIRAGYAPDSVSELLGLGAFRHTGFRPVTVAEPEVPIIPGGPAQAPAEPPPAAPPATPALPAPPPPASAAQPPTAAAHAPPRSGRPTEQQRRLSRRLMAIDRRLRERILAAADAAVARALERAGNRVRSAAQRDETAKVAAAGLPGEKVPAALGRAVVAALGADEQQLLAEAFDKLHANWTDWTQAAAAEAIDTAARITGLDRGSPEVMRAVGDLRDRFTDAADAAWPALHDGLNDLAVDLLYNPDPTTPEVGELSDGMVHPGLVRQALATAGGLASDHDGLHALTGLTSGHLLQSFIRDNGAVPVEYEWAYGISSRTFHPHARLDGLIFAGYNDPALSTAGTGGEWVGGSFAPGDHKGCHCDVALIYADGNTRDELEAIGRRAYEEQKPGKPVPGWAATVDPKMNRPDNARPETRRSPAASRPLATSAPVIQGRAVTFTDTTYDERTYDGTHDRALRVYKSNDEWVVAANAALRAGLIPADPPTRWWGFAKTKPAEYTSVVELIDDAISRSTLTADAELWRGAALTPDQLAEYVEGATVHYGSWTSTAYDRHVAQQYADVRAEENEDAQPVMFRLLVPGGTPVGVGDRDNTELVIGRGSRWAVQSVAGNLITLVLRPALTASASALVAAAVPPTVPRNARMAWFGDDVPTVTPPPLPPEEIQ